MLSVTSNTVTVCPLLFSLLHGKMKPDCEQSTTILQTKDFQGNSTETMDIYHEIENTTLEARIF
jgi:hypothetical protein